MVTRLNALSLKKKFSMRRRLLEVAVSVSNDLARLECCPMWIFAPRSFTWAMMLLLSKALSAIEPCRKITPRAGGVGRP